MRVYLDTWLDVPCGETAHTKCIASRGSEWVARDRRNLRAGYFVGIPGRYGGWGEDLGWRGGGGRGLDDGGVDSEGSPCWTSRVEVVTLGAVTVLLLSSGIKIIVVKIIQSHVIKLVDGIIKAYQLVLSINSRVLAHF